MLCVPQQVVWIDGPALRLIAEDFPEVRRSMRKWTLYNSMKQFLLENLHEASPEEREEARAWVKEQRVIEAQRAKQRAEEQRAAEQLNIEQRKSLGSRKMSWKSAASAAVMVKTRRVPVRLTIKEKQIGHKVTTIERLHDTLTDRFDSLAETIKALERRLDSKGL